VEINIKLKKEKEGKKMVGMARLELTAPRSQSECATNCATSRQKFFKTGVSGGIRTLGPQSHNLMLYQLSYTHHSNLITIKSIWLIIGKIKDYVHNFAIVQIVI
jgi:hypothetical protein